MDQPDAIVSFQAKGKTWLIEANEGDSRGYTGYNEEVRGRTLRLGAGDTDKDGDFDELYPANLNASSTNNTLDDRSGNMGPDPEGVAVAELHGRIGQYDGWGVEPERQAVADHFEKYSDTIGIYEMTPAASAAVVEAKIVARSRDVFALETGLDGSASTGPSAALFPSTANTPKVTVQFGQGRGVYIFELAVADAAVNYYER